MQVLLCSPLCAALNMGDARNEKAVEQKSLASQVLLNLIYVSIWIGLSGTVILYNKWILAYYGFPYPIALTIWHMTFSSGLAFAVVRLGYVEACNMSAETYVKAVVPIGACFAGTLWLGNAAYLYLSVSFIQMLKVGSNFGCNFSSFATALLLLFCVGCHLLSKCPVRACCVISSRLSA